MQHDPEITRKERKRIARRAKKLLRRQLDSDQRKQLRSKGYFDVVGSRGNVYRIGSGFPFNVRLVGDAKRSRIFFCMEAEDRNIPKWDVMLGEKLLIETDEGDFLKTANLAYIPRERDVF